MHCRAHWGSRIDTNFQFTEKYPPEIPYSPSDDQLKAVLLQQNEEVELLVNALNDMREQCERLKEAVPKTDEVYSSDPLDFFFNFLVMQIFV